jgi:hypothetical protein
VLGAQFNETFIIIKENDLFIFSSRDSKNFFYELCTQIEGMNIELYFPNKADEQDSEKIQILKIAKFVEKLSVLKRIGMPLTVKEKNNIMEVERWPLIAAYGLDALGEGFFTLKHEIVDISLE